MKKYFLLLAAFASPLRAADLTISPSVDQFLTSANYAAMRAYLSLVVGTDVQAYDADLTTWAGIAPSANGGSLVAAASYAAMRGLLDLEAGTDFLSVAAVAAAYQPLDADLTTIAGLVDPNADRIVFWDDSAGAYAYLTAGTGLTITGTSIAATSGAGDVTAAANFGTDNVILRSDGATKGSQATGITVDDSNNVTGITSLTSTTTTATTLVIGATTVTASGAELNILDGVTSTAAELNALDGITPTVTELNYTDGVTSAIQTQLNAKVTTGAATDAFVIAISDETTAHTTGTAKVTFRAPYAFTITAVRGSLTTVSSSGTPTWDINEAGATILSTKLTLDASEKTSTTAVAAAVISDTAIADDAEITIDIDTAGTGAAGGKITIIHTH